MPSFGTGCLREIPSSSGGNPRIDKKAHFRNSHRKCTSCIFWVHKCSRRSDRICSVLFQLFDVDRQARIIPRGPLCQIRVQKERHRKSAVQTACHNCARKGLCSYGLVGSQVEPALYRLLREMPPCKGSGRMVRHASGRGRDRKLEEYHNMRKKDCVQPTLTGSFSLRRDDSGIWMVSRPGDMWQ